MAVTTCAPWLPVRASPASRLTKCECAWLLRNMSAAYHITKPWALVGGDPSMALASEFSKRPWGSAVQCEVQVWGWFLPFRSADPPHKQAECRQAANFKDPRPV